MTTKNKRGRPPKSSKPATAKPAAPVVARQKTTIVTKSSKVDDQGLLNALGTDSPAGSGSPRVESLPPLATMTDQIAADKLGPGSSAKAAAPKPGELPPTAQEPLALWVEILPMLNQAAKEARSMWAASDPECRKAAEIFDRLTEKYLPDLGPYSLEATAAGLLIAYLLPRVLQVMKPKPIEPTPAAAGQAAATGAVGRDERVDKL